MAPSLLLLLLAPANLPPAAVWAELLSPKDAARAQQTLDRVASTTAKRLARRYGVPAAKVRAGLDAAVAERLVEVLDAPGIDYTRDDVERRVIGFEAWRLETFVAAGVFPKRYFGYLDGRADTGPDERRVRAAIRTGVATANRYLEKRGDTIRITEAEIAVTWISEGGALILFSPETAKAPIHPVLGVGLDDIAIGFRRDADLVRQLDAAAGTDLRGLVGGPPTQPVLTRFMTLEESVLGTVLMYVYEKRLCERKLRNAGRRSLSARPLDEQFVLASLVYNSGLLFSEVRVRMILRFGTGAYLDEVSKKNAKTRWPLPVRAPKAALRAFVDERYPHQPTSWAAVYHILQRYGGWVGLYRFSDAFTPEGRLRKI